MGIELDIFQTLIVFAASVQVKLDSGHFQGDKMVGSGGAYVPQPTGWIPPPYMGDLQPPGDSPPHSGPGQQQDSDDTTSDEENGRGNSREFRSYKFLGGSHRAVGRRLKMQFLLDFSKQAKKEGIVGPTLTPALLARQSDKDLDALCCIMAGIEPNIPLKELTPTRS